MVKSTLFKTAPSDAGIVLEQQIDGFLGHVDPGLQPFDDQHCRIDAARQHAPIEACDDSNGVDHDEIVVGLRPLEQLVHPG